VKIVVTNGCVADAIEIDGVPLEDLSFEDVASRFADKLREGLLDGTVTVHSAIGCFQYDEWKQLGSPCDQCGDTVYQTTYLL
jgi:hypothetical protein